MTIYLAHRSTRNLNCCFYTIVVKNKSLKELFPGGLNGFIQTHLCRCNNHISVGCCMGGDIDEILFDLYDYDFETPRDFILFDAAALAIDEAHSHPDKQIPRIITTAGGWLKIGIGKDGIYVRYAGVP